MVKRRQDLDFYERKEQEHKDEVCARFERLYDKYDLKYKRGPTFYLKDGVRYNNKYYLDNESKRLLQKNIILFNIPKKLSKISRLKYLGQDQDAKDLEQQLNFLIEKLYKDKMCENLGQEISLDMINWASRNLNSANYKRFKRVYDRTGYIVVKGRGWFVTLTFSDEVLANTSEETRKRYATRALKKESVIYIGNKDYGGKKGREHYHAIIESEQEPQFKEWKAKYGFVKVKKIGASEDDAKATAKYTAKLSYHAIKHTTKNCRIIYSRFNGFYA